jgi:hypothetical protein
MTEAGAMVFDGIDILTNNAGSSSSSRGDASVVGLDRGLLGVRVDWTIRLH